MGILRVDGAKCKKDGICVEVCPVSILMLDPDKGPAVRPGAARLCIGCGHCVAACPHGALDNVNNPLAENVPLDRFPVVDPEAAFAFLRSRRSIRCYREDGVPREALLKLLDIARFAPSGHNSQGISYLIVEGAGHLRKIRDIIIEWMKLTLTVSPEMANRFRMPALIAAHEQGEDKILRSAPHLVVAHAPKALMPAQATTCFALEYVELFAAAMGLGTCWAGYAQVCAQMYPPLAAFLDIPEERQVTGILMVGYPKYRYYRLPRRNPLDVAWLGESKL